MRIALGVLFFWLGSSAPSFSEDAQRYSIFHVQQFAEDPYLTAHPGQMVLLDGPPDANQTGIRYRLQGGRHEFCLKGNQRYFNGMLLEDAFGQEIARRKDNAKCITVEVPTGVYTIRVSHSRSAMHKRTGVGQITVDPPSPPLTDATGDAIGGFWAVQPDPNQDAQQRDGRLCSLPPISEELLGSFSPPSVTGMPITVDYTGTQIDQYALFRFRYGASSDLEPFYPPNTIIDLIGNPASRFLYSGMLVVGNYACQGNEDFTCWLHRTDDPYSLHNSERLVIHDLGHYQFDFQWYGNPYNWPEPRLVNFWLQPYTNVQLDDYVYVPGSVFAPDLRDLPANAPPFKSSTGPFQVVFRFFPDGNVGTLQEGEVALYDSCNYQGKAIVLGTGLANFLEWDSNTVDLKNMGASVRLGKDAAISFYEDTNFGGAFQMLVADSPCTSNLPRGSIHIQSITSILTSTNKCPKCQLTGLDLRNLQLANADLTGANLEGADLSQTVLSSAKLQHADLKGAKLYGAVLDNANLESAILQSAYLTNNPPTVPQAASLGSAFLRNANLSFAQMSGANFSNASFYGFNGVGGNTCAIQSNGETNGCATASHAIMNNTVFSGAYLFGVDFTNTQATGVNFSNAVLVGANFDKAILGSDSMASTTTSFDSAFLQGANLATLDHVSLAGAFVDFRPSGNIIDIQLPGSHTQFPGYWNKPSGQAVCAEPGYSGPTTVPATNSTITCPNGNKYLNGCTTSDLTDPNSPWNSKAVIDAASTPASYQNDATYTKASTNPICQDDVYWDVGGK